MICVMRLTQKFQSTHPHRVRPHKPTACITQLSSFNPRTHTGCDGGGVPIYGQQAGFNPRTHTGCDRNKPCKHRQSSRFNPRTHTGCDPVCEPSVKPKHRFQSTHPHRVRPQLLDKINNVTRVSIHAPTQGATLARTDTSPMVRVSIHAPTQGATRASSPYSPPHGCFNPRTHIGCD